MIDIVQFQNELMSSNCFVVYDSETKQSFIVDPASEKSKDVIDFIENKNLSPEFILLTHEHTDHTWGCNALIDRYDKIRIVCSQACKDNLSKEGTAYFQFYFNKTDYIYNIKHIDIVLEDIHYCLQWDKKTIYFYKTPGHSKGSVCFLIDNKLFTGDTIMQYKPFIPKKTGSKEDYKRSVQYILDVFEDKKDNIMVYPGHGKIFLLSAIENFNFS
jgi:Zn-dependent hydrolases, including glyoxylases